MCNSQKDNHTQQNKQHLNPSHPNVNHPNVNHPNVNHPNVNHHNVNHPNASHYASIIQSTGEDLNRAGLLDTPNRAAKAFDYLTRGYHQDLQTVCNDAIFPTDNDELVLIQNIEFYSLCEHHLLPFYGVVHVGYLPDGNVLGLSKVARIVDMYARRLQIQENLTKQVADAIVEMTACRGVAVVMDASHMCMMMRGVGKQMSTTRTTSMLGEFAHNQAMRQEFISAVPKREPRFG